MTGYNWIKISPRELRLLRLHCNVSFRLLCIFLKNWIMHFSMPFRMSSNLCYQLFFIYCKQFLPWVQLHEKKKTKQHFLQLLYINFISLMFSYLISVVVNVITPCCVFLSCSVTNNLLLNYSHRYHKHTAQPAA